VIKSKVKNLILFNNYKLKEGGYLRAIFVNFVVGIAGASNGNGGWF
jgi:hypothetical protein